MAENAAAVVGAAGGVGATRLTVELGATLVRAGRDVALLDAAYATQGLARHVEGPVDPDLTAVLTGDATLRDGLLDYPVADLPGRLAVCPARAPFERLARAKTPDAARALETLIGEAATRFDHVLVDTPPVAANQAVAAVTAADRTAVVTDATDRGADALQRVRARLADVGCGVDLVVGNRVEDGTAFADADVLLPEGEPAVPPAPPASVDPESRVAPAVAPVAESLFGLDLDLEFADGLLGSARRRFQ